MNQTTDNETFMQEYMHGRNIAIGFGSVVYIGVVLLATALFIAFILTAFPEDAYLTRAVMTIGGLMVGGSMIAFPLALHKWAIAGSHRKWATVLYYGEMLIIALNTFVSFSVLLSNYAGWEVPEWVRLYEPFTVASIMYTLFAWGTLYQTDPLAKAHAKKLKNMQTLETQIAERIDDYLHTAEGEDMIRQHADQQIGAMMSMERYRQKHWGTAGGNGHKKTTRAYAAEIETPSFRQSD